VSACHPLAAECSLKINGLDFYRQRLWRRSFGFRLAASGTDESRRQRDRRQNYEFANLPHCTLLQLNPYQQKMPRGLGEIQKLSSHLHKISEDSGCAADVLNRIMRLDREMFPNSRNID
jgi:hypothetical protein